MKKNGKVKRVVLFSFVGALVTFLTVVLLIVFVFPYANTTNKKEKHSDWMKNLDGDQLITDLVLPGSHDSAANISDLPFFTKTQYTSIQEQLEIGVRTFDMRLTIEKERIKFTHSSFNCKENAFKTLYLEKVCNLMYDFLNENPSETILFIAKHEHGKETISELEDIFYNTIKDNANKWYLNGSIPTLSEARGKIVLLTRYQTNYGINVSWIEQSGKDDTSKTYDVISHGDYDVCIQDRYQYKIDDKWSAFTSKLPELNKPTIVLNYLSTTEGGLTSPTNIAKKLNNKFMSYDVPSDFKGSIMLDFINSDLVGKIINKN